MLDSFQFFLNNFSIFSIITFYFGIFILFKILGWFSNNLDINVIHELKVLYMIIISLIGIAIFYHIFIDFSGIKTNMYFSLIDNIKYYSYVSIFEEIYKLFIAIIFYLIIIKGKNKNLLEITKKYILLISLIISYFLFGIYENIIYIQQYSNSLNHDISIFGLFISRLLTSLPFHVFLGLIFGYIYMNGKYNRIINILLGLVVVIIIHILYNVLITYGIGIIFIFIYFGILILTDNLFYSKKEI